ncbi:MAG: hypothetical protein OHK0029_42820 [Armatimonadaceae bacterium]
MEEKKSLPAPVIIAIAVAALALAVFMGWRSFAPPPPAALDAGERKNADLVAEMVKRTNGDMSKLTNEDKQKLYEIAGNFWTAAYNQKKKDLGM